jgi:ABC-type sugar transport system substrate-binding protein
MVLGGCGDSGSTSPASTTGAASSSASVDGGSTKSVAGKKVFYIAPVGNAAQNAFSKFVRAGLGDLGVKLTYRPDNFDAQQNLRDLDAAIAAKPDLIILTPLDAFSIAPAGARAKAAGVPIIIGEVPLPPNKSAELFKGSVTPDDKDAGRVGVETLVKGMKDAGHDSGNVILVNGGNTVSSLARFDEIRTALKKYPSYKVVADLPNPAYDAPGTQKLVQPILAKYSSKGGIQGILSYNEGMTQGVVQAAQQAGTTLGVKKKGTVVVDTSCGKINRGLVKTGEVYGTRVYGFDVVADKLVAYARDALNGVEVPRQVNVEPGAVVTAANADDAAVKQGCY